ncbi:sigma-70 family RNA polymerase sigma factor [Viridibacillus sp. YIM B01967]|uniref:Sigma-70 family RNA polymerase sigma factor n=1 Tax=Viridibacillus soli TaxID=2798301 RepID=A0ABS1H5L1_9BACL|nr:sigma-70 family RNA polymerase sigma factor [Viridibacillus soli]MBK3494707.1 sigma-70 family RNA polymerase sigma factor [Viridibacillus soli]
MKTIREKEFFRKYANIMKQPIMKGFLKSNENQNIFSRAINSMDKDSITQLNSAFRQYYKNVILISYISKTIHFSAIDFDKRLRNYYKKNLPIPGVAEESNNQEEHFSMDVLMSSIEDTTFNNFQNSQHNISDYIGNPELISSMKSLSNKQLYILELIYIHNINNKQIAKVLNESEQTISYNHHAALEKLRKACIKSKI